ncbi:MAG TPA: hypothetical protein VJ305_05130 [Streptosporangiaceae bacterium]|nr:hypothetical protein [Streptosporangiaceae bacterium]
MSAALHLTFSMTLEEVIAGCEEAWQFFSGVFRVVVPDNMSPVVAKADTVNPQLTREWLEYSQARGFATDPARVRHPRDKSTVRRTRAGRATRPHVVTGPGGLRAPRDARPAGGGQLCQLCR